MPVAPRVLFLPGASGEGDFWRPVGEQLPAAWEKLYFSWPGLGAQPHDLSVGGFDQLVARVAEALEPAGDLVAQSMGGVVAVRVAAKHPQKVRRLVLAATSGGVDVARLGGVDWREDYQRTFPHAARWVSESQPQQTDELKLIKAPTLLLWGEADPISPVSVGEHLLGLLPSATLHVIANGTHSFAHDEYQAVAPLVGAHLGHGGSLAGARPEPLASRKRATT